jgi:hypothetical protein
MKIAEDIFRRDVVCNRNDDGASLTGRFRARRRPSFVVFEDMVSWLSGVLKAWKGF